MRKRLKNWIKKTLGITSLEKKYSDMENLVLKMDEVLQQNMKDCLSNSKNIAGHEIQIGTVEVGLKNMESWGEMAVDLGVSPKSDSYMVIATKLHGGIVKIIPLNHEGGRNILETIKYFESRFGIKNPIKDLPRGMRSFRY